MADAAQQLANVLPVIVVGGVATKMTESMFPGKKVSRKRKAIKKRKRRK